MTPQLFLQQLLVSVFVGGIIGLEREYSAKQKLAGMRTFSLISFLGMLSVFVSGYAGDIILPISFIAVILFVLFFKFFMNALPIGLTTLFSMVLSFLFGILVGFGLFFEAISATLITVFILLGRKKIRAFVSRRTHDELIDVVEFAIIAFVVYPILPDTPILLMNISFDLHVLWYTILVVSMLSFLSFLAVGKLGNVGILAGTFFGSLLSSTLTIAELNKISKKLGAENLLTAFNIALLTMFLRNLLLVGLIAPVLLPSISIFMAIMAIVVYQNHPKFNFNVSLKLHERKPFSVNYAIKVSIFLFLLTTLITLIKDNVVGVLFVAFLGGMVSSASSIASVLFSFSSKTIPSDLAKLAICFGTLATLFSDFIFINSFGSVEFKKIAFQLMKKLVIYGLLISIILFFLPI